MTLDPCTRCGSTLLDLRANVSRDALRGAAPLCPVPACPLVQQVSGFSEAPVSVSGTDLMGASPPAVFVGRHGYPRVTVGPLFPPVPVEDPSRIVDASALAGLDIADVLRARSQLVRSKAGVDARQPLDASKALEVSQQLAMTDRPVDTEVTLAKPPRLDFTPRLDTAALPMGPSVDVVRARLTENAPAPRRVDAAVGDVHADAATVVNEMYNHGVNPDHIQRLLSVGLLGERDRRRLVPTRWSITATDDILGKRLVDEVKAHPTVDKVEHYKGSLFGNHFHVLLLPRVWQYQMVEAWREGSPPAWGVGEDSEPYAGRKSYASTVTGAYYAAKLSVLEQLARRRRQAAVLVYREITEDYWAPLGVWVIREAVRAAMEGRGLPFEDVAAAEKHVTRFALFKEWRRHATLLDEVTRQRTLGDFLP